MPANGYYPGWLFMWDARFLLVRRHIRTIYKALLKFLH